MTFFKFNPAGLITGCFLLALFLIPAANAQNPIISEIMASNGGALLDEDGDSADWIELYNPTAGDVNLAGWHLTDVENDPQWEFPAVTLPSGGFLVVFASGKNRRVAGGELHTDFNLSSDGEYLALLRPNGTPADEFDPGFPEQRRDISYGIVQNAQTLVASGASARYRVPNLSDASANWTAATYNDGAWGAHATPLAFGLVSLPSAVSHWTLDESSGNVANDEVAGGNNGTLVGNPAWQPTGGQAGGALFFDGVGDYVTIGNEADYDFTNAVTVACWIKASSLTKGWQAIVTKGDNSWRLHRYQSSNGVTLHLSGVSIGWSSEGTISINDGQWHFVAGTYDGSEVNVYVDGALSGTGSASGNIAASDYPVMIGENGQSVGREWHGYIDDVFIFDRGLTAAQLDQLQNIGGSGNWLESQMKGVNATLWARQHFTLSDAQRASFGELMLRMKYEDGFAAYLNGTPLASANAPGTPLWNSAALSDRPLAAALAFENFGVSQHLSALRTGDNVLAIQGLNDAAANGEFMIEPELIAASNGTVLRYFTTATPGAFNTSGFIGFVPKVVFGTPHGYPDAGFNLTMSCPDPSATIRYTIDGSEPTATNGVQYNPASPPYISTTRVVRAIGFRPGYGPSTNVSATYIFVNDVIRQPTTPPGFPTMWLNEPADYEMDPDVVNNPAYSANIRNDLKSLPALSLVCDVDDVFGASAGIYANPNASGVAWERPCSVEYFDATGAEPGFQVNCGLRIYGGVGRNPDKKKHTFRLLFKSDYGPTKLRYPIFEKRADGAAHLPEAPATDEFDTIILRAGFNNSWHAYGQDAQGNRAQYIRDQWMSDSQLLMGRPSKHGNFVHLYVNGLYWGVYNPCERPNADFASSYSGGLKEDWDALNSYPRNVIDGNPDAWIAAHQIADAGVASQAGYDALAQYVDMPNLIDYMLLNFYAGNLDWDDHNWYAAFWREGPGGYQFYSWDAERVLENPSETRHGGTASGGVPIPNMNITSKASHLFQQLRQNPEFVVQFGDAVHKHFDNGGVLTPENTAARYQALADWVEQAIVCESARWGDVRSASPSTRDGHWLPERNRLLNQYFPARTENIRAILRNAGMYPTLNPPVFNIGGVYQHGGIVNPPASLSIINPNGSGSIYYTTDESDPRLPGGGLNAQARIFSTPVTLSGATIVKARVRNGGSWSALNEAKFELPESLLLQNLRVTEVHYNPGNPTPAEISAGFTDSDDFEFIELCNLHPTVMLDLSGVRFTDGIDFTFPESPLPKLAPRAYLLLVRNRAAFELRYGASAADVAGEFINDSGLSNGGERLEFRTKTNAAIQAFTYNDAAPWPPEADGAGSSLESLNPSGDANLATNWRASLLDGGSPGSAGGGNTVQTLEQDVLRVVEVHYHPAPPSAAEIAAGFTNDDAFEFVELRNLHPTEAVDLTGVQFNTGIQVDLTTATTDSGEPATVLPPAQRAVLAANPTAFAFRYPGVSVIGSYSGQLANDGETLRLIDRNGATIQIFDYDDQAAWPYEPDGLGPSLTIVDHWGDYNDPLNWRASYQLGGSPGGADVFIPTDNLSYLRITELHYHPAPATPAEIAAGFTNADDFEFIELLNTSRDRTLNLANVRFTGGVEFNFSNGAITTLPARWRVLVVSNAAAFDMRYGAGRGVAGAVTIGNLDNSGEWVRLVDANNNVIHHFRYNDRRPWPESPDGCGPSLVVVGTAGDYNDPANWRASYELGGGPGGMENFRSAVNRHWTLY